MRAQYTQPPLLDVRPTKHPAPYSMQLFPVMARMIRLIGATNILDPMAGTGRIFRLWDWLDPASVRISALELEPEFAEQHNRVRLGDATAMPYADGSFDCIVTSPAYGNRMADGPMPSDTKPGLDKVVQRKRRLKYAAAVGRKLHPNNGGGMQWGQKYRDLHMKVLAECARVLGEPSDERPQLGFVLNMKNHIRDGKEVDVIGWWVEALGAYDFELVRREDVPVRSMRWGANSELRVETEAVMLFLLRNGRWYRKP